MLTSALLTQPLDEDVFIVTNAVFNRVNQLAGLGPTSFLIERNRMKVINACVQFKFRVAAGGNHGLSLLKHTQAQPRAVMIWVYEQVD